MTNQDNRAKAAEDLRQKAEALAREQAARTPEDSAALSPEEIRKTLYELLVYQIELEMQNAELRTAQAEIEAGRSRYFDLYDLAPVGYCILSEQGLILDANLTIATLLGLGRAALIKQPISRFIHKEDQDIYYLHRKKLFDTGDPQKCDLRLVKPDGACFWAHLKVAAAPAEDGAHLCRVVISDITERKQAEEALKKSEATVQRKLKAILEPIGEIGSVTLSDIIDQEELQRLMDDLFRLTGTTSAIIDIQGNVLVACGWQDICTRFHRVHTVTRQHCVESDTVLTTGTAPGEVRLYQCRNGMWDVVTPIHIGGNHIGNVFCGQFFFDDESPDSDRFRRQARQYGFDEEAYLAALDRVPRWSREKVDRIMAFYARLAATISMQGYGNLLLARSLSANERTLTALRESEALLSRAQEIAHTGSWKLDTTANHLTWSDEVYRIFGCEPQAFAVTYEAFLDFVHTEDRAAVDEAYSRSLREGRDSYAIEHRIVRRNSGEVRHVHERCVHERDDAGVIVQSIGMVQDITERKQAEDAVKEARKLLEAKNKEMEELVYVASHDLRSPLVNVDGFSRELEYSLKEIGALMENGKEPAVIVNALLTEFSEMGKSISRIRASAAQMDNLLKALLKLSRTGRTALHIDNLDMNQVLGKLAPSFAYRLQAEEIKLNVMPLPPCRGDAVQVTQVFANLIDNAIKYLAKERPGVITISGGSADGNRILYRVADNGMGIDEQHLKKIFELFYRLKPKENEGEGIGLTMVRQILLRMGGEITVESKPGAGSVFSVSLPEATSRPDFHRGDEPE